MTGWRLLAAAWALLGALLAAGAYFAFYGEQHTRPPALVSLTPSDEVFVREDAPAAPQADNAQATPPEPETPAPSPEIAQETAAGDAPESPAVEEEEQAALESPGESEPVSTPEPEQELVEETARVAVDPATIPVRVERRGAGLGPAWLRNATPFSLAERRPLVAVVVTRLGLAAQQTQDAILKLPPEVSLSFTPYARGLDTWIDMARRAGHEALLDLPMEGAPGQGEAGHFAMSTQISEQENLTRLNAVLQRSDQVMGVTRALGDVFVKDGDALFAVLGALKQAGLAYLDTDDHDGAGGGGLAHTLNLPHAEAVSIATQGLATRLAVDAVLASAEARAMETGGAVVVIEPSPVAYERLGFWMSGLGERGLALAPLSELILRGEERYLAESQ